jgi:hypothetical protein
VAKLNNNSFVRQSKKGKMLNKKREKKRNKTKEVKKKLNCGNSV